MAQNDDRRAETDAVEDRKQTNLAEGERETVEESLRNHERRGDLQTPEEKKQRNKESNAA